MSYLHLGTLALAALAMLAPVEILEAQRGGPRRGRSVGAVEQALLHKQRLELTDDQVAELESLRQEAVAHRKETLGEVLELESQTRSGQITGQELRARRETQRDHAQVRIETLREHFDGILTEAQRNELRSEARRGARGARRGFGQRGQGRFRQRGPQGWQRGFDGHRLQDRPMRPGGPGRREPAPPAPPENGDE